MRVCSFRAFEMVKASRIIRMVLDMSENLKMIIDREREYKHIRTVQVMMEILKTIGRMGLELLLIQMEDRQRECGRIMCSLMKKKMKNEG